MAEDRTRQVLHKELGPPAALGRDAAQGREEGADVLWFFSSSLPLTPSGSQLMWDTGNCA